MFLLAHATRLLVTIQIQNSRRSPCAETCTPAENSALPAIACRQSHFLVQPHSDGMNSCPPVNKRSHREELSRKASPRKMSTVTVSSHPDKRNGDRRDRPGGRQLRRGNKNCQRSTIVSPPTTCFPTALSIGSDRTAR